LGLGALWLGRVFAGGFVSISCQGPSLRLKHQQVGLLGQPPLARELRHVLGAIQRHRLNHGVPPLQLQRRVFRLAFILGLHVEQLAQPLPHALMHIQDGCGTTKPEQHPATPVRTPRATLFRLRLRIVPCAHKHGLDDRGNA
jgi:hypothetical protein